MLAIMSSNDANDVTVAREKDKTDLWLLAIDLSIFARLGKYNNNNNNNVNSEYYF